MPRFPLGWTGQELVSQTLLEALVHSNNPWLSDLPLIPGEYVNEGVGVSVSRRVLCRLKALAIWGNSTRYLTALIE